jgi:hypothetical protein
MNQDSKITAADIAPMLSALTDQSGYQSTHSFNSHTLTNADLLAAGDINKDGALTNADLQALLTELQNPGAADAPVTRSTLQSSLTTGSDHYPVVADYSVSVSGGGSSSSVPEPSSLALLGLAGLLTFGRYARQRRAG